MRNDFRPLRTPVAIYGSNPNAVTLARCQRCDNMLLGGGRDTKLAPFIRHTMCIHLTDLILVDPCCRILTTIQPHLPFLFAVAQGNSNNTVRDILSLG